MPAIKTTVNTNLHVASGAVTGTATATTAPDTVHFEERAAVIEPNAVRVTGTATMQHGAVQVNTDSSMGMILGGVIGVVSLLVTHSGDISSILGVIGFLGCAWIIFFKDKTPAPVIQSQVIQKPSPLQVLPAGFACAWLSTNDYPTPQFIEARGQSVAKCEYPELLEALRGSVGITENETTFTVPDLQGQFLRGDYSGRPVGSRQEDAIKSHTHELKLGTLTGRDQGGTNIQDKNQVLTGGWGPHGQLMQPAPFGVEETRPKNTAVKWVISTGK